MCASYRPLPVGHQPLLVDPSTAVGDEPTPVGCPPVRPFFRPLKSDAQRFFFFFFPLRNIPSYTCGARSRPIPHAPTLLQVGKEQLSYQVAFRVTQKYYPPLAEWDDKIQSLCQLIHGHCTPAKADVLARDDFFWEQLHSLERSAADKDTVVHGASLPQR